MYKRQVFGRVDEDGVVGLEVVFGEEVGAAWMRSVSCEERVGWKGGVGFLPFSLDVQERVLEAEELVGRHDCGCSVMRLSVCIQGVVVRKMFYFLDVTMC